MSVGGGEEGPQPATLDAPCVEAWNSDPAAVGVGQHSYVAHRYETAWVSHVRVPEGRELGGDATPCAVIFPSRALDPERPAAGLARLGGTWIALSGLHGFGARRLAELQAEARTRANAALGADGRLGEL